MKAVPAGRALFFVVILRNILVPGLDSINKMWDI